MPEPKNLGEQLAEARDWNRRMKEQSQKKERNLSIVIAVLAVAVFILFGDVKARGEELKRVREDLRIANVEPATFQCGEFNVQELDFGGPGDPGDSTYVTLTFRNADGDLLDECERSYSIPRIPSYP